jgi:hypothetical protein
VVVRLGRKQVLAAAVAALVATPALGVALSRDQPPRRPTVTTDPAIRVVPEDPRESRALEAPGGSRD